MVTHFCVTRHAAETLKWQGLQGLTYLNNKFSQCCVPSLRNVGIPAFCVSRSTEFQLWAVEEGPSWRLQRRTRSESAYVDENLVFSGPSLAQSTIRDYPISRLHDATAQWCGAGVGARQDSRATRASMSRYCSVRGGSCQWLREFSRPFACVPRVWFTYAIRASWPSCVMTIMTRAVHLLPA